MFGTKYPPLNRSKRSDKREFNLSACVIVKNEAAYILEWIAYHRVVGFDFFYIYDNDSTDRLADLLAPMVAAGVCIVIDWPRSLNPDNPQVAAYHHCLWNYGQETAWLAIVDADEFLVPRTADSAALILDSHFRDAASVICNWRLFGSSGQLWASEDLCINRFQRASESDFEANKNVKSIFRPSQIEILFVHNQRVQNDNVRLSDGTKPLKPREQTTEIPVFGHMQINHYYCKSLEEFKKKRLKGLADHSLDAPYAIRAQTQFHYHDRNECIETTVLRFVDRTKSELIRLTQIERP